jgi:PAS domain S-box-containing protein
VNWILPADHARGTDLPGLISTNPARCRDCYRCVRTCPVKAVRVRGGQAEVVTDLCIACASCVRACPQGAKVVRDGLAPVKQALAEGRRLIATVAPSAPAYFEMSSFDQMAQTLGALGFSAAAETASGAEMVGQMHGQLINREPERWPIIASACPVVVNLIEQYYPDLIPHLAPVVSPMIAHGRYLRQQYGADAFIVFIGPCVAKKGEAADESVAGAVDAVLTYVELEEWLDAAGVAFETTAGQDEATARMADEPAGGEQIETTRPARLFPMEGGLIGTARLDTDLLSSHTVTGSGIGTCQNMLEGIRSGAVNACLVELMACGGGCINGPALMDKRTVIVSRQRVMAYAAQRRAAPLPPREAWPSLARGYRDRSLPVPEFTEEQIREVLRRVDKYASEDELNCGSCGYPSCREKAIATLRGMAEATMCIPYMRSRAESLNNVVMDATPNAILVVDKDWRVQDISPAAGRMFNYNRLAARGRPLSDIMPVLGPLRAFQQSADTELNEILYIPAAPDRGQGDLIVDATVVTVQGQNLMVMILRDVTEREQQRKDLDRVRAETLQRSQEVINKQMRVAHEIAGLLGETTAETKVLLTQLTRVMEEVLQGPPSGGAGAARK